jgi:hypothetical protein
MYICVCVVWRSVSHLLVLELVLDCISKFSRGEIEAVPSLIKYSDFTWLLL